ncbi:MAG TPA: tetratricopeptide repeat protein [Gaiellaceae bacterium]|nr:tetratricopeptide repeat protein [Gaiellaceae bacterium]
MRDLPSGTVTFLFTDIEGSTRLLSELGDGYADALAEHRRVVREACRRYGGVEVDTQGDAFFLAFSSAASAVRAAGAAQEMLALPVRMGIHTGEPQVTSEGYVGLEVHEGARICGVAHGGQVVLSRQAHDASGPGHAYRDLGLHRLKDLTEPVRLYQLGDRDFPTLRSLNATNLPALPNPLVGRERELEELTALLRDRARLITLTGAGGTGKTRLALEVAAGLIDEFSDGVFWAPLASLREAELALPTIEETIGAKTGLAEHVDQKRMLLLLDNFEQLLPAATELATLLARCPNLKLLVTSRAVLRISGEREFQVAPLPNGDAVTLFMQRARAVRPDLEPDGTVAEICRRLDGLPLAIELAAARVRIFEPRDLLARLEPRLSLLTGGPSDLPARQRTLRATIEWSYGLLGAAEQAALARLTVFATSWNAEAAESVCETELEQLDSLVQQNLVAFRAGRFFMLETIREFALERLRDRGEEEAFRLRHARYFVERAERTAPGPGRPRVREHLAALEADSANMLAAMAWLVEASHPELALRLGGALRLFWQVRGHAPAVRPVLEQALALDGSVEGRVRAKALMALAGVLSLSGDLRRPQALLARAQQLYEEAGDSYGLALCLLGQAWIEMGRADFDLARELAQAGFELAEHLDDKGLQGLAHNHLGLIASKQGDVSSATELLEGAVAHWREGGNDVGAAAALSNLANLRLTTGDLAGAEELARRALALNRAIPYELHVAMDLELLGMIAIRRHRREEAALRLSESLMISRDLFDTANAIDCLELLAATFPQGEAAAAASCWGTVAAFRDQVELPAPSESRGLLDDAVEECRRELGEQRFQEAWSQGYALPVDEAIDLALSLSEQVAATPASYSPGT